MHFANWLPHHSLYCDEVSYLTIPAPPRMSTHLAAEAIEEPHTELSVRNTSPSQEVATFSTRSNTPEECKAHIPLAQNE